MKVKILEVIKQFDIIIIYWYICSDSDVYGFQCGLVELLKIFFSEKKVYVMGEEVELLKFLYWMDDIVDDIYEDVFVIVCDMVNEV